MLPFRGLLYEQGLLHTRMSLSSGMQRGATTPDKIKTAQGCITGVTILEWLHQWNLFLNGERGIRTLVSASCT
jgi:hypothetical protein